MGCIFEYALASSHNAQATVVQAALRGSAGMLKELCNAEAPYGTESAAKALSRILRGLTRSSERNFSACSTSSSSCPEPSGPCGRAVR